MRRLVVSTAAALVLATSAFAEEIAVNPPDAPRTSSSQGWSVVSAQTVGENHNFVHVQAGYPGIFGTFLHGGSSTFDFGGKFGFVYGAEGGIGIAPGLRLQGVLRWLLSSNETVRLGLEFEPGLFTYFTGFGTYFGVITPVKFTAAFPITSAIALHAGVDLPISFNFVSGFFVTIPILLGGGIEYFLNDNLSLNFRLRLGPSIVAGSAFGFGASGVTFGLDALLGVAIRI